MRSPFLHVENAPLPDEPGDVRFPTPVPKSEGPGGTLIPAQRAYRDRGYSPWAEALAEDAAGVWSAMIEQCEESTSTKENQVPTKACCPSS